ncbi:MAG: DinB family protein [Armatimonadetes bacterium]|nr:DinB family protein [Armatimonadota bacterium]
MNGFDETWELVRKRFDDAVAGLDQEQLNFRMHDGALTIGEMAVHVAGVEVSFVSQLLGEATEGVRGRVKAAATDGVVNERPFPFTSEELTPAFVSEVLDDARAYAGPVITQPSDDLLRREIVSALGPVIDGRGALARLAYHPGYHQGQVHLVKTAPGFPK